MWTHKVIPVWSYSFFTSSCKLQSAFNVHHNLVSNFHEKKLNLYFSSRLWWRPTIIPALVDSSEVDLKSCSTHVKFSEQSQFFKSIECFQKIEINLMKIKINFRVLPSSRALKDVGDWSFPHLNFGSRGNMKYSSMPSHPKSPAFQVECSRSLAFYFVAIQYLRVCVVGDLGR